MNFFSNWDGWKQMPLITKAFFLTHILLRLMDAYTHFTNPMTVGSERAFEPYGSNNMSGVLPSPHVSWESGTQMLLMCFMIWPLAFKNPKLIIWMLVIQCIFIASFWVNDSRFVLKGEAGEAIRIMFYVNPAMLLWGLVSLFIQYRKK